MAIRHLIQRVSPTLDRRWLIGLVVVGLLVVAGTFVRWGGPLPPLELVALGPDATFQDTLEVPADWADTTAEDDDVAARIPLVLGVRNPGTRPVRPERLELSLPVRYRIDAPGEDVEPRIEPSTPLVTYTLRPDLGPIQPQRLPVLLPAYDTLWLEVVIPSYYCVAVADSVPEFIAAPPPPLESMRDLRIFYAFEGGDLARRLTGILAVRLDTAVLHREMPPQPPSFPMETGRAIASPDLGALTYAGSRQTRCGEPEAPMELLSTVWETGDGGRFIALDYGGAVRKHLYDLDADGVIERESWDPDRDGVFDATRRARLPIPGFLLPQVTTGYDVAALDTLPPDSLARLDPYRRAMPGPGRLQLADSAARAAGAARAAAGAPGAAVAGAPRPGMPPGARGAADTAPVAAPPPADSLPAPVIQRPQPLGRPLEPDTTGPGGGGGAAGDAGGGRVGEGAGEGGG